MERDPAPQGALWGGPNGTIAFRVTRMSGVDQVRVLGEEVLSQGWPVLRKYTISYRRRDGRQETQSREIYDHGHGAALLPYDPGRGTILLVRQFRLAAWLTGHREMLVEVCAGLLDG